MVVKWHLALHLTTDKSVLNITFTEKNIKKVWPNLDSNKAHRHDIDIHMLKICGKCIKKPPEIIYKDCLEEGHFPTSKCYSCLQNSNKQLLKNYQPISLLSIWIKVLRWLRYSSVFKFFMQNKFITPYQSGFMTGDLCINQLISISHEIYKLCWPMRTEALVYPKHLTKYCMHSLLF